MDVRTADQCDGESGEVVRDKVIVLRKRPGRNNSSALPLLPSNLRQGTIDSYPLIRENHLSRCFRIQDALNRLKHMTWKPSPCEVEMKYHRELMTHLQRMHYTKKPPFRIPNENFSNLETGKSKKNRNAVSITYWEEFLYGVKALDYCGKPEPERNYESPVIPFTFLRRYLPKSALKAIAYCLFFLVYVVSVFIHNMLLESALYVLCANHMEIHNQADKKNVEVSFVGSVFMGPGYVWVENWCEHCQQKKKKKIVNNLMKKMKSDILERQRQV